MPDEVATLKPTRKALFFTILASSLILAACGQGGNTSGNSAEVLTEAAQIAFQALTETAAAASPTPTPTETPTNTPLPPTATPTPQGTLPTLAPTATRQQSSGGTGCLRAELTYESPQDGAQYAIGENFKKVWVFKNVGACTWTQGFSLVFIQGDLMGAKGTRAFSDFTTVDILPGDHLRIEVTFIAPNEQGTYKGYWMLRSDGGNLFGLGQDGRGWFWVEIFAKH